MGYYPVSPRDFPTSYSKTKLVNFFETFFNLNYFILCCPFRLKLQKELNGLCSRFRIVHYWPQKLVCGLLTPCTIYWIYQGLIFPSSSTSTSRNPTELFQIALRIINAATLLLIVKTFWFDQSKIQDVMNQILETFSKTDILSNKQKQLSIFNPAGIAFTCIFHSAISLFDALTGSGVSIYQVSAPQQKWENLSETFETSSGSCSDHSENTIWYWIVNLGYLYR